MKIKFNDGVEFDTDDSLRTENRYDGLYVVRNDFLIPVKDCQEAQSIIAEITKNK